MPAPDLLLQASPKWQCIVMKPHFRHHLEMFKSDLPTLVTQPDIVPLLPRAHLMDAW